MTKIINWYEDGPGKNFINEYTNVDEYVMKYYKEKDSKEVSGVYIIKFNGVPIYIVESGQMGKRFIEHMYNLVTDSVNYFGVTLNKIVTKKIKVRIDILDNDLLDVSVREKKEIDEIETYEPVLQKKYERYYPRDKALKDNKTFKWMKRDEIRSYICIRKEFRRERILEELKPSGKCKRCKII